MDNPAASDVLRIRLIDDDPDHVMFISRAIREVGPTAEVRTHQDGEEALAALHVDEPPPDLILLDINMAGLSGFEVLTILKRDQRLKRIPVVMLTSSALPNDMARAYELGANGYVSKPSYLQDLRAVLGNTLLYWSAMKRATPKRTP
jgi:CheY-like chemotaxis protein